MTRIDVIRKYIAEHPGCESSHIQAAIGATAQQATAYLAYEINHHKHPSFTRRVIRTSPTGTPIYGYFPIDKTQTPAVKVSTPQSRTPKQEKSIGGLDALAEQLAAAFAEQVAVRVKNHITLKLSELVPDTPIALPTVEELRGRLISPPPVPRKTSVLIAGLLPMQAGIIQQEFGDVFDLRFFEANANLQKLKDMVKHVDALFTFTSKIPHAVEEVMSATGKPIHRCSGGMTMLKDRLTEFYVETTKEA